jgi:ABC-type Fe3+-siderophore transport system permease subunit
LAEGFLPSERELTGTLSAICVAVVGAVLVVPFFIPEAGDLMIVVYAGLSLTSAIIVSLDRKSRATSLLWVPAVLLFCFFALPVYMLARRRRET